MRVLSVLLCALVASQVAPGTPARAIVVIGDLHMGVGLEANTQASRVGEAARTAAHWHPYEDFRWRDEFTRFLDAVNAEGGGTTDLVINGDLFELLQSATVPCGRGDEKVGCSAEAALQRLETVIDAHAAELQAIGRFARAGSNRVHVIPGDHDAALLMPAVWRRAAAAFGAPADRVVLATTGGWLSADHRVYVEHGHQLPLSADRFANWPNPVIKVNGRDHLERPWGEQVILPLYNRTETRFPIVDNVAEEGVGAKLVAAIGDDPPEGVPALLRYFLTKTTWQQFRMDLDDGDVQPAAWNIDEIRRDLPAFLTASLPSDDPFSARAKKASQDGLTAVSGTLTDADITAICDYRAAIRRARRRMERVLTQLAGVGAPVAECPRLPETIGPAYEYYWRTRDQQAAQYIDATFERLRRDVGIPRRFDVVIFGHTHLQDRSYRPFGESGPVVVNNGAWQRIIHPIHVKQLDVQPETLAPCYAFLRVPASTGNRVPEARVWRSDSDQQWTISGSC